MKLTKQQLKQIIKEELKEMMQKTEPTKSMVPSTLAPRKTFNNTTKELLDKWRRKRILNRMWKLKFTKSIDDLKDDFDLEWGINPAAEDYEYYSSLTRAKEIWDAEGDDHYKFGKIYWPESSGPAGPDEYDPATGDPIK